MLFFNYAPKIILNNDIIMTHHYTSITRMDGQNISEIYLDESFSHYSLH